MTLKDGGFKWLLWEKVKNKDVGGKNGKKKTGHNALKAHIFYLYTGKYISLQCT